MPSDMPRGLRLSWPAAAALLLAAFLAGVAVTFAARAARTSILPIASSDEDVVAVIDAEVPGTEVYLRGQRLGVVPVKLTRGWFAEHGLKAPVDDDGWGEGLFFGDIDEDETKVMLKAPDGAGYLTIDTPWGRRTKLGGEMGGPYRENDPPSFRALFMPAVSREGLSLKLTAPPRLARDAKTAEVSVSCTNTGPAEVAGVLPDVTFHWGTFDTPWRRRTRKEVELPAEWAAIRPGQTVRFTTTIEVPTVAGDYSLFATFHQYKTEKKDTLATGLYSDSVLMRVR